MARRLLVAQAVWAVLPPRHLALRASLVHTLVEESLGATVPMVPAFLSLGLLVAVEVAVSTVAVQEETVRRTDSPTEAGEAVEEVLPSLIQT